MPYQPDPAFAALFRAFTSAPDSIGAHITRTMAALAADAPLLVSTGSDIVLFPGADRAPSIESFRKSTRGFIELTALSHLPLALAYLARMRELAPHDDAWRADAERLAGHARQTRAANSLALWREHVAVDSFGGHERKIANLVDYTCAVTLDRLARALHEPDLLSFERLNAEYFAAPSSDTLPVSMNEVMFATFGLAFLDIAYRIGNWLRAQRPDWQRLMVLVSGQSGRPTAGATWASNNMCYLVWRASERVLPAERILVAPHAPSFSVANLPDAAGLAELERRYRDLWLNTQASIDVARRLFPGQRPYRFDPQSADTMPPITSPDDRDAAAARLRRIMEDPAQLLSNCVADYVVDQLHEHGNRPQDVVIPGFTNVTYPDAVRA
ncbi:DUF5624 domain-containing protein [Paraburkholderia sp. D15]|uniref:DUF5624 domain-containing protein n=1 Tax=Paraburkholderia sp. D15 TaxID=2880218 RepID=UPI00247B0FE0|nr:DUF5624 domain-containing protein [Paraburkholderia sp. D15]WGS51595.1 DUF5624 domain-containing protein [Paraburkholderia sp. D15]WKF55797.1 hypothetical protein HUO10_000241 [Paraburkholderia busanensis]